MRLKTLILPILGLFILSVLSYAQDISYEPRGNNTIIKCPIEGKPSKNIFEFAKEYSHISKEVDPDANTRIKVCCAEFWDLCKKSYTKTGHYLTHIAAYEGNRDLLEFLVNDMEFPKEEWEFGGHIGDRTELMLASERGHLDLVKSMVLKLKVPVATKNGKGKTAYDLARENEHWDVVAFFEGYFSGYYTDYEDTSSTNNPKDIINTPDNNTAQYKQELTQTLASPNEDITKLKTHPAAKALTEKI